jgi:hypothetical protein
VCRFSNLEGMRLGGPLGRQLHAVVARRREGRRRRSSGRKDTWSYAARSRRAARCDSWTGAIDPIARIRNTDQLRFGTSLRSAGYRNKAAQAHQRGAYPPRHDVCLLVPCRPRPSKDRATSSYMGRFQADWCRPGTPLCPSDARFDTLKSSARSAPRATPLTR